MGLDHIIMSITKGLIFESLKIFFKILYFAENVSKLVEEWLSLDRDPNTRSEVQNLYKEENYKELYRILGKRMTFGTAGLRGVMRAGFACMNNLTVQQASQVFIIDFFFIVMTKKFFPKNYKIICFVGCMYVLFKGISRF